MRRLLAALGSLLLVAACLGSDFADSIEGSWILESGTLNGEPIELHASHSVTLVLEEDSISGTAACNGYQGGFRVSGSAFEITDGLAVTEMGCVPEEIMMTERGYLDALLASDTVVFENGKLIVSGAASELVYTADEGSESDPTGDVFGPATIGSWQLISGAVDGVPIPVVASHPITLEVGDDSVGGTSACNRYGIEYRDDRRIEVSGTAMACEPNVMVSESAYLEAITRANAASVEDGDLALTGDGVELLFLRLDPAPVAELVGTDWVLESLIEGDAVVSVGGEPATLVLSSDGTFAGSTGCRSIAGEYTFSGAEVLFTSWGAEGECPGELADQDGVVVTVLGDGFRVEVDGDTLTLWSRGDQGLIYRASS